MKEFSLLKVLQVKPANVEPKEQPKITYQRYDVPVEGKDIGILIPIRECESFESSLELEEEELDNQALKKLLRKHRGVRVRD